MQLNERHQVVWKEPLIFELGAKGRRGHNYPSLTPEENEKLQEVLQKIPETMLRKDSSNLPEVSEVEVVRHYTRLSETNYGVDSGFYPLGSCTMKYNPKINEVLSQLPEVLELHPYQPIETVQGALELMYKLGEWLKEIAGMDAITLQPAAGAAGEFTGVSIIKAYHEFKNEGDTRTEIIVPDSAHGTNPASSSMAGFKTVVIPSNEEGCVDLEALEAALSEKTAGLMLTNPNTLGLFEKDILKIAKMVHDAGGLVYYDGANLNPILGRIRPGDMGFDIVHFNLHKAFSTPHGGGGPGAGPVGVKDFLKDFLPVPTIEFDGEKYYFNYDVPHTIGKVHGFYGNFAILVRAFAYILRLGKEGLKMASALATLNSNYLLHHAKNIKGFSLPYAPERLRMHEFVLSAQPMLKDTGVSTLDISKRMLDFGMHPPTIYFPLIVHEALMIEPTETESKEELDRFIAILQKISEEAYNGKTELLHTAPHNTAVGRVDEVLAARHPILSYRMLKQKEKE